MSDHSVKSVEGLQVPEDLSKSIFKRKGEVEHIRVFVNQPILK
jgi:hypothetical protein